MFNSLSKFELYTTETIFDAVNGYSNCDEPKIDLPDVLRAISRLVDDGKLELTLDRKFKKITTSNHDFSWLEIIYNKDPAVYGFQCDSKSSSCYNPDGAKEVRRSYMCNKCWKTWAELKRQGIEKPEQERCAF